MKYLVILFLSVFTFETRAADLVISSVLQNPNGGNELSSGGIILLLITAVLFLWGFFTILKRLRNSRKKVAEASGEKNPNEINREVMAAITYALYLYQESLKDQEHLMLTIKQVQRTYSPWNSRTQMLRKWPR